MYLFQAKIKPKLSLLLFQKPEIYWLHTSAMRIGDLITNFRMN